jgi:hypothetical protein
MNNISHPNLLNTKKNTMTYVVGNPGPGLGQTQKSGRDKPIKCLTLLLLISISSCACLSDIPCDNTFIWLLADTSLFCKSPTWKKKGYVNKCWYICFR